MPRGSRKAISLPSLSATTEKAPSSFCIAVGDGVRQRRWVVGDQSGDHFRIGGGGEAVSAFGELLA